MANSKDRAASPVRTHDPLAAFLRAAAALPGRAGTAAWLRALADRGQSAAGPARLARPAGEGRRT
jgi:hypothetical protein